MSYSTADLKEYGITQLKKIAKELGIPGLSKYKSDNKKSLERLIVKTQQDEKSVQVSDKELEDIIEDIVDKSDLSLITKGFIKNKLTTEYNVDIAERKDLIKQYIKTSVEKKMQKEESKSPKKASKKSSKKASKKSSKKASKKPSKKASKKASKKVSRSKSPSPVRYTSEEIRSMGITTLKNVARDLGISGYGKYRSGDKKELENIIIKKLGKKPSEKKEEKAEPPKMKVKYNLEFLQKKTVVELKSLAKSIGLVGYSKLKKDELIESIIRMKKPFVEEKEEKEEPIRKVPSPIVVPVEIPEPEVSEDLSSMNVKQLRDLLKSKGVEIGLTTKSKAQLIELAMADRCNPVEDIYCSDDQYCDLRNNVCVKSKINNLFEMNINNKKVLGSKKSLDELTNLLRKKQKEEEQIPEPEVLGELEQEIPAVFEEEIPFEEEQEVVPPFEVVEEPEEVEEKKVSPVKPPPLMESQDIEVVLSEIMEGGDDFSDILDQDVRERMVLRCLSLLQ